jgi:hypothetical protein
MYVGAAKDPLRELETMLAGYYASLALHGIVEPVPDMSHHFGTWLYSTTGWSTSAGWALAVQQHSRRKDPLSHFFQLVDQYRKLKPELRFSVPRPVGARTSHRPTRIDIIRYVPTRLHFLRLWYGQETRDDRILMDTDGNHLTSLAFAKHAVARGFPEYPLKPPRRTS